MSEHRPKLLAIASGGGHWVQLMRLRPAFEGYDVSYVTTLAGLAATVPGERVFLVQDASRNEKILLLKLVVQLVWILVRVRPAAMISTGAAPGLIALSLGKLFGTKTIWLDSIANSEKLSLSGELAHRYADLWLTQWPELTRRYDGLKFGGAVL